MTTCGCNALVHFVNSNLMSLYRSELEVPINKSTFKLRSTIDLSVAPSKCCSILVSTFENSVEKVTLSLGRDKDPIKILKDNLLLGDSAPEDNFNNHVQPINIVQHLECKIAKGTDGNMHFTAKFDVKHVLNPDGIKVLVKEGSLIISVEQTKVHSAKLSTSGEYTRKYSLPPGINIDSITCTLTMDSILCLDAVLDSSFSSSPNASSSINNDIQDSSSSASSHSLTPQRDDRYRITMKIGICYDPQDVTVRTIDDRLFIKARHQETSESGNYSRKFSKYLTLPDKVETSSLSARLLAGVLYIEAPFFN